MNIRDAAKETIPVAAAGILAEAVAVLLFFAAAFVWLVILADRQ